MRIKNRDLTHYFLRQHDQLPRSYLKSCKKFFREIEIKNRERASEPGRVGGWARRPRAYKKINT